MKELFEIYSYAFLLCPLVSIVLAIQGAHLVARKESLALLALAEASLFGNILGHLFSHNIPLYSLLFSLLMFLLIKFFLLKIQDKKEVLYIVIYITFIALSYLLITLSPNLDTHLSVGFFGDIVSISRFKSLVLSLVFLVLLSITIKYHRFFLSSTIDKALLRNPLLHIGEEIYFIAGLVLSLYGLGVLFTMAFVIFPVVLTGVNFASFKKSLFFMALASGLSSVSGLALSIAINGLSTVPTQIIVLLVLLLLVKFIKSIKRN